VANELAVEPLKPRGLSIREAARKIGCSRSKAYDLLAKGQLKARKIGRRTVVLSEDVDRLLDSLPDARDGRAA
jgi:excisionase family DNA binding protein